MLYRVSVGGVLYRVSMGGVLYRVSVSMCYIWLVTCTIPSHMFSHIFLWYQNSIGKCMYS